MSARRFGAMFCASALLSGCAGGSSMREVPAGGYAPQTERVSAPGAGSVPILLTIEIRVPRRHADFVSPSTKGVRFAFRGSTHLDASFGVKPGLNKLHVKLRTGKYKVTISAYDEAPVKNKIPAKAKLLAAGEASLNLRTGKKNRLGVTLEGVPKTLTVSGLPPGTIGTAFTLPQTFSVTAADAGGNVIVGTYDTPVKLADSDASGTTALSASVLATSTDGVTLSYKGGAIASATITASAAGATSGTADFTPAPVLTSMSKNSGVTGAGVSETLHGHFASGATSVEFSGSGVSAHLVDAAATEMTATFFVDPSAAAGARTVTVATSAGQTSAASETFTVTNAGVAVVTKSSDTISNAQPGICPDGSAGELRYVLCNASAGDTIVFDTAQMCGAATCAITLSAPLPPIVQDQAIDGGYFGRITIDGANAYRAFWVDTGTVSLANLKIEDAAAKGGNGGSIHAYTTSGGGGAGFGGGLFVNAATANVSVVNDYFVNCSAVGGNGGTKASGLGVTGSGGGGLGGNGGQGNDDTGGGAGGGGVLGAGAVNSVNGGNGGYGGGGGGGGEGAGATGGSGGTAYAGNASGGNGGGGVSAGSGGSGGFGGGGGGGAGVVYGSAGSGANGGFGGGGGGGGGDNGSGPAGSGGYGGGGGGAGPSGGTAGSGGALGGNGSNNDGQGGGGGAAGPAIFVNAGTLTTVDSGASGCTATAGAAGLNLVGATGGATPGTAVQTPVYNVTGSVNGITTQNSGIASALGGSAPSVRRKKRHDR